MGEYDRAFVWSVSDGTRPLPVLSVTRRGDEIELTVDPHRLPLRLTRADVKAIAAGLDNLASEADVP